MKQYIVGTLHLTVHLTVIHNVKHLIWTVLLSMKVVSKSKPVKFVFRRVSPKDSSMTGKTARDQILMAYLEKGQYQIACISNVPNTVCLTYIPLLYTSRIKDGMLRILQYEMRFWIRITLKNAAVILFSYYNKSH